METDLENLLQTSDLNMFLGINATSDEGMNAVAKRYGLVNKWKDTIEESKEDDCATKYYKLLVLVKTTSKKDNVWISFVEGLHRHAAIVMCLTCSDFDLKDNYIDQGSLKNKAFKNAAVPHYRNPQRMPIQVLNDILNNDYEAPMLQTPFLVQVIIPKHGASQIDDMMTTFKENSKWISTNKRNSAEKTMAKRLSEELAIIMDFSKPKERSKFRPKLHAKFKYQVDMDSDKFLQKI
jgi:ribosomal protein S7